MCTSNIVEVPSVEEPVETPSSPIGSTTPETLGSSTNSSIAILTQTTESYAGTSTAVVASGAVVESAAASIMSSAGAYTMISQMQNLMISPLITGDINDNVAGSYENMDYMMMNFNFLPDAVSVTGGSSRRNLSSQTNIGLYVLGLKSKYAYENIGKLLFVFFLVVLVHLIVAVCYFIIGKYRKASLAHKIFGYVFRLFSFHVYIRLIFLQYFFFLLCC